MYPLDLPWCVSEGMATRVSWREQRTNRIRLLLITWLALALNVTNATSESLNAKIQWLKRTACGFRNRERFRNAIYFHCGGLDMYPRVKESP